MCDILMTQTNEGPAAVSDEDDVIYTAAFRGRTLSGKVHKVPPGYAGRIYKEDRANVSDLGEQERKWVPAAQFKYVKNEIKLKLKKVVEEEEGSKVVFLAAPAYICACVYISYHESSRFRFAWQSTSLCHADGARDADGSYLVL